jgi:predicted ribosome quality control (RQC) complex YloA/Tae2 family protein
MAKKITILANCNNIESVKERLKNLEAYYLDQQNQVKIGIVEKYNVDKKPESYYILEFKLNEINIYYTEEGYEESFRKWDVIKKAIPILEMVAPFYNLKASDIISIIDNAINDIFTSVPQNVRDELIKIEKLKTQISRLEEKIARLEQEKSDLQNQIYQLSEKLDLANSKLTKYEKLTDDELRVKIIEWIKQNNGEFDSIKFAEYYDVPEIRVKENLEFLIKNGYITVVR